MATGTVYEIRISKSFRRLMEKMNCINREHRQIISRINNRKN